MTRLLLTLIAILSLAAPAAAQRDSVDAMVHAFLRARAIPSAAVSVVHHGRVVKSAGFGLSNLELRVGASAHSVYEIGSITKQVTAVAVMQLMEAGKLRLDDSLSRYLPEIPDSWRGISLRHLLTHTSGVHDWEGDSAFSYRREYSLAEFIAFVSRTPLDFAPGSRFGYTNSAFPLLGVVVERVSGMSYERYVTEHIFGPAGMMESRFRHAGELVPNRASGYVDLHGVLMNGEPLRPAILAPNGMVLSTASDMARWNVALSRGTLVKPATMAVMLTPTRFNDGRTFNAGITWFFAEVRGHRAMLHNGSTVAGFSSVIYRFPDDELSVVVLLNIDRGDAVNVLATQVAGVYVRGLAATETEQGVKR